MRHEFAFYIEHLSDRLKTAQVDHLIQIEQQDLVHRLCNVVRMQRQGVFILFDSKLHARVSLHGYKGKKIIECVLNSIEHNNILEPRIIALLPILKRDAFEQACYNLVELGVSVIMPVITQKIHRSWSGTKEMERIRKVIIAAAEQAKQFSVPEIYEPLEFEQALTYQVDQRLYGDPEGNSLWDVVDTLRATKTKSIAVMIGPEGDLTQEEKERLAQAGFMFCALTPTILRSYQAISLMVGCLRSLL